jgi:hypothetical protein
LTTDTIEERVFEVHERKKRELIKRTQGTRQLGSRKGKEKASDYVMDEVGVEALNNPKESALQPARQGGGEAVMDADLQFCFQRVIRQWDDEDGGSMETADAA